MATDSSGMRRILEQMASARTRDETVAEVHGSSDSAPEHHDRDRWPASSVQEQLWLLDTLSDIGCAYNVPFALEIEGRVPTSRVTEAVWGALDRHDGLNTTFTRTTGTNQVVQQRRREPLRPHDFEPESVTLHDADAITHQQARATFDLGTGPLVTVRVLTIDADHHRVVLVAHHAVVDGWSMGVITREIAALLAGEELAPAPSWSKHALTEERDDDAIRFWREQVSRTIGSATGLQPDHDTSRPALRAGTIRFDIPDAAPRTQQAARSWGVSPFVVQFAAFQRAIARLSDLATVVTGVPLINRTRSTQAQLVGPLSNTLPISLEVQGTAHQLVSRADAAIKQALAAQSAPVSAVLKDLPGLDRSSGNPLFQQLFNVGNLPGVDSTVEAGGLRVTPRGLPNNTSRTGFELTLESDDAGNTRGRVEYDLSLYSVRTGQQVVERFQAELQSLCQEASEHDASA